MITRVIDWQHVLRVIRIRETLVEVDHSVEGTTGADPIVNDLVFLPLLQRPVVICEN